MAVTSAVVPDDDFLSAAQDLQPKVDGRTHRVRVEGIPYELIGRPDRTGRAPSRPGCCQAAAATPCMTASSCPRSGGTSPRCGRSVAAAPATPPHCWRQRDVQPIRIVHRANRSPDSSDRLPANSRWATPQCPRCHPDPAAAAQHSGHPVAAETPRPPAPPN